MGQAANIPQWLFVRFEQGRGKTGVPKMHVPYFVGRPGNPHAVPEVRTLVRQAVELLRAQCADANLGHGRDLMPGENGDYALHNIDGGLIQKAQDIKWTTTTENNCARTYAEVVLTWKNPAELLHQAASRS